jgi:hypothetical protein
MDADGSNVTRLAYPYFNEGYPDWQPVPVDSTPPVIQPSVTGTLGQNGWYTSDVSVAWSFLDPESPVASSTGCDDVTITEDTAGTTIACSATSLGGSASSSVTIKRDATAPSLNPSVSPGLLLLNATASAVSGGSDEGSGLGASSCGNVDSSSVGTKSLTCSATDLAGNESSTTLGYSVAYRFVGFSRPVVSPPSYNKDKAGQLLQLRWRLLDASFNPVTAAPNVVLTVSRVSCADPNIVQGAPERVAMATVTLVNEGDGYYQLKWRSSAGYANSCRLIELDLLESVVHPVIFAFSK